MEERVSIEADSPWVLGDYHARRGSRWRSADHVDVAETRNLSACEDRVWCISHFFAIVSWVQAGRSGPFYLFAAPSVARNNCRRMWVRP